MTEQIHVEQALFGYREGHDLVGASIAIAPRVRQFLANVTDGSGPGSSQGFEGAYTGLPVPETNYYALFSTWPAPEMPRPGCVWSHVLLLDLADLARIPDLSMLRVLFRRPGVQSSPPSYEQSLSLPVSNFESDIGRVNDQDRAVFLIKALYGEPKKDVIVLDEQSSPWEEIIFALWSQQWPRFRRSFGFSTGSLGDRRAAGVAFDLQIAPLSSQPLWGRSGPPCTMLLYPAKSTSLRSQPWIITVLDDLRSPESRPLRRFLFTYGSEVEAPRSAFVPLVELFVGPRLGEDDTPDIRLARIATSFPQPSEALSLKRDQLAALMEGSEPSNIEHSWAVIYFLLKASEAAAFSRVPLSFSVHVALLWQRKRADVLALLGDLPQGENATTFLHALAAVLAPQDIPAVWHEQPATLPGLLAHQPGLTADPAAWKMPETGQRALWNSLHAATNDERTWALACGSMLRARCALNERETVTRAGRVLADGLLNWLKANDFCLPTRGWRDALREPLTCALRNESLPLPLLALSAWVLPPEQARALPTNRPDIQALAQSGFDSVPESLVLPTYFWLTALAFQSPAKDGLPLLVRAFVPVYAAVANSKYPREAWDMLAPVLPELPLRLDWDRCRRLRRALKRWLRDNPTCAAPLSRAASATGYGDLVQSLIHD